MADNWIHTAFSKDSKWIIIIIIILCNILSFLTPSRLQGGGDTPSGRLFNFCFIAFFQVIAWGLPLAMYFLSPLKVSIYSYSEIKVMNRIGNVKTYTREQIHKVYKFQQVMSKEWIYIIHYNRAKPLDSFGLDLHAGKSVWDWYHNEGEWKMDEVK